MINKPPPLNGLNSKSPITIPIKGKGFIYQGSGLLLGGSGRLNVFLGDYILGTQRR